MALRTKTAPWVALALAAIGPTETEQTAAPSPGPCVNCGVPATCYGRHGLRCDTCCHDWCQPMPAPSNTK